MNKLIRIPFLILMSLLPVFTGCDKDNGDKFPGKNDLVTRVVFIYMGADNSLGSNSNRFDIENIEAIKRSATYDNIGKGRVVVFHDGWTLKHPQLIEIKAGAKEGVMTILKTYPEYEETTTADMNVFLKALEDTRTLIPAFQYSLIMWSHASGWLPGEDPRNWWTRSAGDVVGNDLEDKFPVIAPTSVYEDSGKYIELEEFAAAIPEGVFDYIVFDECYMAGVEVAWAMRNKTNLMLVSSAEVMGSGLPYEIILPYLFTTPVRLGSGGVGELFYRFYNESKWTDERMRTATTALWDCSQIDDEFADMMKAIINFGAAKIPTLNLEEIQYYDRYTNKVIFDIKGFVDALTDESEVGKKLRSDFTAKLNRIVTFKRTTKQLFGITKDPEKYSGMTTYIPVSSSQYTKLNEKYKNTEWYKRVYPEGLIP